MRHAELVVKVPQMAESISEGTLSQLLKKVGDRVEPDEELATIETDKIDVSVNAPEAGVVAKVLVQEGDTVTVGQDLVQLETGVAGAQQASSTSKDKTETATTQQPPVAATTPQTESTTPARPTDEAPVVEHAKPSPATEQRDTKQHDDRAPPSTSVESANRPTRGERTEKLSRMRKTIATRLKQSQDTCASLTTVQRVDMSNIMAWRAKYKEAVAESHGVKLGYMGAFAKAATLAAQRIPQINASIDTGREIITYRDYVDISIAVSTPKGLVTPVVRDCETKNVLEIERDIGAMAKKARDGKLTMDDLEGGNFSISNPGIFGSMFGTPLINYPQAAVFNINAIKEDVVAVDGKPEIRPMMYITLTYDHRLIDGREAVSFLNLVKGYVEDPAKMLLF
ncbi:Dihydrolipoyllysine-residue succinyltransferase [Purpureocillium takamizusanense]|uniref:dihydrolipoyllysine-residue succinyltransferase n=1 Tax=Purpureocillium takamizusanense TaxID=2060973 RepID=A0A9Q8VEB0_9HYPO|nr:Dihydrolipoyllysine-residue succinyltransferase [Purpureocillium takamizusanense]UNI23705.1 Dihydrolipoyllysine-residue succinyltransferase [Purpureocillium takamizusanense]